MFAGAPIDLFPKADKPAVGADPLKNNDFDFDFPADVSTQETDDQTTQSRCPFAAHIRKTYPRADLEKHGISIDSRRILRRGIQYGPEVTASEAASGKTQKDRGLLFQAYQSNIASGFQFIQQSESCLALEILT